jgi:hypothetical protein
MQTTDDWFAESSPEPTLNELYDRRLVAWGYLTRGGSCTWELTTAQKLYDTLLPVYITPMQKTLNESPVFLRLLQEEMDYLSGPRQRAWTKNPEGPA